MYIVHSHGFGSMSHFLTFDFGRLAGMHYRQFWELQGGNLGGGAVSF